MLALNHHFWSSKKNEVITNSLHFTTSFIILTRLLLFCSAFDLVVKSVFKDVDLRGDVWPKVRESDVDKNIVYKVDTKNLKFFADFGKNTDCKNMLVTIFSDTKLLWNKQWCTTGEVSSLMLVSILKTWLIRLKFRNLKMGIVGIQVQTEGVKYELGEGRKISQKP